MKWVLPLLLLCVACSSSGGSRRTYDPSYLHHEWILHQDGIWEDLTWSPREGQLSFEYKAQP